MLLEQYQLLTEECEKMGIHLTERQVEQFQIYYENLIETNKVMNLTAITEFEDVMIKHFLDSLCIVKADAVNGKIKMIDMGTGAGFPGVPIKIAFPETEVTLMDSLNKRILFLNHVIEKCQLDQIEAIHGRAEEFAKKKEYREQYDLCVSRAVANLASLSEYCLPYVKVNGFFISYKSGNIDLELQQAEKAIRVLGGEIEHIHKFRLPKNEAERSLIVIKKVKQTPGKYPRKAGVPGKDPIA